MKKVIAKKLYDTDTAQELATWGNGLHPTDFSAVQETLYRKRTGEYFLHGEGGPRTQYAERVGGLFSEGQAILPLTYEQAREWAEEKLDADEYGEIFGLPDEGDDSRTVLTVTLPAAKVAKLRQDADKAGLTIGAYLDKITG